MSTCQHLFFGFPVDRRQLLIPVVLPHSGMLPEIQTGNVTEQFRAPCHWIVAMDEPRERGERSEPRELKA